MRNFISILSLALLVIAGGCNIEEKIVVGEPESFKFGGLENNKVKINAQIPIENKKAFNFQIHQLDLEARINGRYLGKVTLDEPVKVLARSNNTYSVTLNLKIQNMLLGASVFYNFSHKKDIKVSLDGDLQVKYLLMKKNIRISEPDIIKYMR